MKSLIAMLSLGLMLITGAQALEPAKPRVSLTVKRQLLDSDHDLRGRDGSSKRKTFTLRVELVNSSSAAVGESTLTGDALVTRAFGEREKTVREALGAVKVPAMKPNEKLTLDLGKITVSEVEWHSRKFEEKLEEWRIVCKQDETEIGKAVSSERYETLSKDIEPEPNRDRAPLGPDKRRFRKFGN